MQPRKKNGEQYNMPIQQSCLSSRLSLVNSSDHYTHKEDQGNKGNICVELKKKYIYSGENHGVCFYYISPQEAHVLDSIARNPAGEKGEILNFCALDDVDEPVITGIMAILEKNSSGKKIKNAITIHVSKFKEMLLSAYSETMSSSTVNLMRESKFLADIKYIMPYGNARPRYRRIFTQAQIRKIMDLSDFVLFTHNQSGKYTLKEHKRELMYFITGNTLFMVSLTWFTGIRKYITGDVSNPESLLSIFNMHSPNKKLVSPEKELYEISLGLDPEILFYPLKNGKPDYGNLISADSVIGSHSGEIGLDACSELGELRPKFSFSPEETTRYAKETLAKLQKLLTGKDIFVEAGGGCLRSIGGHIHIGNKLLTSATVQGNCTCTKDKIMPLLVMLDRFLYYPIKNNIHGGLRNWGMLRDEITGFNPSNENVVSVLKKIKKSDKSGFAFGGYDAPSKIRVKNYGIEYRSLPSFISSEELTYLILKITQEITRHFLKMAFEPSESLSFSFKKEPSMEEYCRYLDTSEAKSFNEFLYGTKNDVFLHHLFNNWNIEQPRPPVVVVEFKGDPSGLADSIKKTIKGAIERNKNIRKEIGKRLNIHVRFIDEALGGDRHIMMLSPGRMTHPVKLSDTEKIKTIFRTQGTGKIDLILTITTEALQLFNVSMDFWREASEDMITFLLDPSFSTPLKYEEIDKEMKLLEKKLKKACRGIENKNDSEYISSKVSQDYNTMIRVVHEIRISGVTLIAMRSLEKIIDKYIPKPKKIGVRV